MDSLPETNAWVISLIQNIYFVKISSEFTLFKHRIGHVAPTVFVIIWKSQINYTYEGGNVFFLLAAMFVLESFSPHNKPRWCGIWEQEQHPNGFSRVRLVIEHCSLFENRESNTL